MGVHALVEWLADPTQGIGVDWMMAGGRAKTIIWTSIQGGGHKILDFYTAFIWSYFQQIDSLLPLS
jgi:hypothetical protein